MSRGISQLTIFILLGLCNDALTQVDFSVEIDGLEDDEREDGGGNGNEKINLMGIDYYNGALDGDREEYATEEQLYLKADPAKEANGKNIVILDTMDTRNYRAEMSAGNKADILGTNPHYHQVGKYPDFSRRFVLQYPYTEKVKNDKNQDKAHDLTPKRASPELVLAVAEKSVLLDAAAPKSHKDEIMRKDILRTGDYWNAVWKEDADPKVLRSAKELETVKAEIPSGTKLYDLVSKLKDLSPTLLYVINKKN